MGEKAYVIMAALVVASIVFTFIAPVIALEDDDEEPGTEPQQPGTEPQQPGTQPEPVGPDNGSSDNQASRGLPISTSAIVAIVGLVVVVGGIAGVWKYLLKRQHAPNPASNEPEPPGF